MWIVARVSLLILLSTAAASAARRAPAPSRHFDQLVEKYYADYSSLHPTAGTMLGLHDHDADLEDMSVAEMRRQAKRLKAFDAQFRAIDHESLSRDRSIDLRMVRRAIAAELLDLEGVKSWQTQPGSYPDLATQSVYAIITRDFAPAEERMRAVIARENKVPALLAQGQTNLLGPPKIAVELAVDQLPGTIDFFKTDVVKAFAGVKDRDLQAALKASTARTIAALEAYQAFLKKEVLPKAKSEFALGEALFKKKLAAEEMIDTPIDEMLERGEAELKRLQEAFRATAAQIDPKASVTEIQLEMQKDHVRPSQLLEETQGRLAGLKQFLVDRKLVRIPSKVMPSVVETPPYMRATTLASMSTPGPFEKQATEAYMHVTLPDKSWNKKQVEDFMRGAFSRTLIDVVAIHEALPGHYVQYLWKGKEKSKVRKYGDVASNAEGWAHYCEQMVLDEGYADGDPKLRLAQLQLALLRASRYLVGIRMHTRGMTLAEGVRFFEKEGLQTHQVAEMEAQRGTYDPTYLYYTAGKLEILRLRDDYKKKLGPKYTLAKFHNAFLSEGPIPLSLMREALLQ